MESPIETCVIAGDAECLCFKCVTDKIPMLPGWMKLVKQAFTIKQVSNILGDYNHEPA